MTRPVGGYTTLIGALADGLDIRLGTEVTAVAADAGGVRVTTARGEVHVGSHVLVTVPLAAPHAGRVLFSGEATTLERLGYADGANRTGLREAKRLLGRASVEVGPLRDR